MASLEFSSKEIKDVEAIFHSFGQAKDSPESNGVVFHFTFRDGTETFLRTVAYNLGDGSIGVGYEVCNTEEKAFRTIENEEDEDCDEDEDIEYLLPSD